MTWLVWPIRAILTARVIDLPLGTYLATFVVPFAGCLVMAMAVLALRPEEGSPFLLLGQIVVGAIAYGGTVTLLARRRLLSVANLIRPR